MIWRSIKITDWIKHLISWYSNSINVFISYEVTIWLAICQAFLFISEDVLLMNANDDDRYFEVDLFPLMCFWSLAKFQNILINFWTSTMHLSSNFIKHKQWNFNAFAISSKNIDWIILLNCVISVSRLRLVVGHVTRGAMPYPASGLTGL